MLTGWRESRLRRHAGAALALLVANAIPSALAAQYLPPQNRGWLFTYTLNASIAGSARDTGGVVLDVAIWHGTARIAVRSGGLRAITSDGGSLLLRGTDSTIAILNPARHDALVGQAQDLSALMGGAMGAMESEVSGATSSTNLRGAGPRLFGFTTQRVEFSQHYELRIGNATARRSIHTEQVVHLDVSSAMAGLDPGFRAFAEYFARSLGAPGPVRQALRAVELEPTHTFPLRIVTVATAVSGSDTVRTRSQGVVSAFRTAAVDTSTFHVPADYRITEISRLLQLRQRPTPPPGRSP